MDATARTPVVTLVLTLLIWFGLAVSPPGSQAQLAPNPDTAQLPEPGLSLDIDALLNDDRVLETSVNSNIWDVTAQSP